MSNTYLNIILESPLSSDYIFNNIDNNHKFLNFILPALIIFIFLLSFAIGCYIYKLLPDWIQKIREYIDDWQYDWRDNTDNINSYSDINNIV